MSHIDYFLPRIGKNEVVSKKKVSIFMRPIFYIFYQFYRLHNSVKPLSHVTNNSEATANFRFQLRLQK